MRVGDFSVVILGGRERESGYVHLLDGQAYKIRLANHTNRRCDVELTIDGKSLGSFRVEAYGRLDLERPPDDDGCFTFYRADGEAGQQVGAGQIDKGDQGLVQARFKVEKPQFQGVPSYQGSQLVPAAHPQRVKHSGACGQSATKSFDAPVSLSCERPADGNLALCSAGPQRQNQNLAAGVTGLSGHSGQRFTPVDPLVYDDEETLISLRLVAEDGPRPLRAHDPSGPTVRANQVPPPAGGRQRAA